MFDLSPKRSGFWLLLALANLVLGLAELLMGSFPVNLLITLLMGVIGLVKLANE